MKFLVLLFIMTSSALNAQNNYNQASDSDAKAIEILKAIEKDFTDTKSHLIGFDFVIESPGNPNDTYRGTLLQAGDNFELDMGIRKIITNNETVWMYLKDDNEVQINDADFGGEGEYMSPSTIFSLYKSNEFIFAISNYGKEDGKSIVQIEGKPIDEESEYSKLRLTVEENGQVVKRLKIFLKNGGRMTTQILSHKKNVKLSKSNFKFSPSDYPGVMVEDLRF